MDKKFAIQFVALLVVIFGCLALATRPEFLAYLGIGKVVDNTPSKMALVKITTQGEEPLTAEIKAEVADTVAKRTKGLGDRAKLEIGTGMLFVFEQPGKYRFWMKGLQFPLDFIWIKDNKVVDILTNVPVPPDGASDNALPTYEPITEVDKILEVNAGFVEFNNIQVGDLVEIQVIN